MMIEVLQSKSDTIN